jgi:hypothetical protein
MAALSQADAKAKVLELIRLGAKVEDAMDAVDHRTRKTYENWRYNDKEFAKAVDNARERRAIAKARGNDEDVASLNFEDWRKRFLGRETYTHQRQWIQVLEGKEVTDLHPSVTYEPGRPERVLINTPPFHAKSTVITQEYATYRICMNPNIRICIVSKTQTKAKKFLVSIKKMLTGVQYAELQQAYAPSDGFKDKSSPWTATMIYVSGRDNAEKDPTVEVLGIGGDIYGGRYDLIILDDCVTKDNVTEFDKQLDWINQEVASRVKGGKIIIVGTRVGSIDLYAWLRNPDNFTSGRSVWTYLAQPAVLEYGETPDEWNTLWPRSTAPLDEEDPGEPDENGEYAAWDGKALELVRDSIKLSTWSLVYMQQQVAEDAIFNPVLVRSSIKRERKPGPLKAGVWGHPRAGMEGQYVIASMDPAMAGDTFTLVGAVDRRSQMRRIMNCWVRSAPSPTYIRDLIKEVTDEYQVNEWVIEQNAFQLFLIHDPEINSFLRSRGVKITPHYTSRNKQDPSFGVASVATLFGTLKRNEDGRREGLDSNADNMIELPDQAGNNGIKALVEQLITWEPNKLGKNLRQDGPMALWFFELRAREWLRPSLGGGRNNHIFNPYLAETDRSQQVVVPIGRSQQMVVPIGTYRTA